MSVTIPPFADLFDSMQELVETASYDEPGDPFAEEVQKFNPNHEPAGSEKGGQFAKAQGTSDVPLNMDEYNANVKNADAIASSSPELKAAVTEVMTKVKGLLDKAVVQINMRSADVVDRILADGRFKTQFETGTSGGLLDEALRASEEKRMFGLGPTTEPESRPIYGTLQDPYDPTKENSPDGSDTYGRVVIRLKPEVKARTTFTGADSLNAGLTPSRLSDPQIASFISKEYLDGGTTDDKENIAVMKEVLPYLQKPQTLAKLGSPYMEAQIHGGVKASDISDIYIPSTEHKWSPEAAKVIKDNGIKVHLFQGYIDIFKFNENHEPAGSPKGGQFAKAPSAAAQKAKEPYLYPKAKPTLGGDDNPKEGLPPVNEKDLEKQEATFNKIIEKGGLQPELKAAQENIDKLMAGAVLTINARGLDCVESILKDGRFKSQFETHLSNGTLDPDLRAVAEHELFGVPVKMKAEERPIYGTLQAPVDPDKRTHDDFSSQYGGFVFQLKPEVRDRATFTADDSLGRQYVPSPVNHYSMSTFVSKYEMRGGATEDNIITMKNRLDRFASVKEVSELGSSYMEAQMFGHVTVKDIKTIYYPVASKLDDAAAAFENFSPEVKKIIKDNNIEVKTYEHTSYE